MTSIDLILYLATVQLPVSMYFSCACDFWIDVKTSSKNYKKKKNIYPLGSCHTSFKFGAEMCHQNGFIRLHWRMKYGFCFKLQASNCLQHVTYFYANIVYNFHYISLEMIIIRNYKCVLLGWIRHARFSHDWQTIVFVVAVSHCAENPLVLSKMYSRVWTKSRWRNCYN